MERPVRFLRDENDIAAWAAEQTVALSSGPPGDHNGEKAAAMDGERAIARVLELEAKVGGLEAEVLQKEKRIGDLAGCVQKLKTMVHEIFANRTAIAVEHVQLQDALEALVIAAPECANPGWNAALTEARNVLKSLEDSE